MPFPSNAIRGQKSLSRKREKLAREAEQEFSSLPDWMFWEKKKRDAWINVQNIEDVKGVLRDIGDFINLMIKSSKHYEEREG